MNLESCFQMLIKANKYSDSEFRIKKFLIWIFGIVHKLGKKVVYIQSKGYILIAKL